MKHPPPPKEAEADFSEAEIARRRDEIARRMLNMPYTPQAKTRQPKKKKKKGTVKA
jgi:hypothetical protein